METMISTFAIPAAESRGQALVERFDTLPALKDSRVEVDGLSASEAGAYLRQRREFERDLEPVARLCSR